MPDSYRARFTIEYDEPLTEAGPKGPRVVGTQRMSAEVQVWVDLAGAASKWGRRACKARGKRWKVGPIAVECIDGPTVVSETRN